MILADNLLKCLRPQKISQWLTLQLNTGGIKKIGHIIFCQRFLPED